MAPEVARILRLAVDEEMVDGGRKYPPNVVEVALLSYAWQVADSAEALYEAFAGDILKSEGIRSGRSARRWRPANISETW
jgi:hypothetical protein